MKKMASLLVVAVFPVFLLNAQNAITWNGQSYDPGSADNNMSLLMGYNNSVGVWTYYTSPLVRAFLGIPSTGETLQSVTDRQSITTNRILVTGLGANSPASGKATYLGQNPSGFGVLESYDYSTINGNSLSINPNGGNVGIGTTNPLTPLHVSGGSLMTGSWNKTATLQATFPVQLFNSNNTKWAGIGYDYSEAFRIWVNATSDDVNGTGINAFNILNDGNVNMIKGLRLGGGHNLSWGGTYEQGKPTIASAEGIGIIFYPSGNAAGETFRVAPGGNVGIGTQTPTQKLSVNGTILAKKVKVSQSSIDWPDYVFDSSYQLLPLQYVETYIQQYNHLPDVPSAAAVKKEGLDLGDNQAVLLRKIEELTLYIIEQNKQLETQKEVAANQKQQLETQKQNNAALENRLSEIERRLSAQAK
jgi:hypothetical protein